MFDWVKKRPPKAATPQGEGRSLEELFRLQRGPLVRFITSKLKDPGEAEEIVQEAFIRFQAKYAADTIASPEALLARIATNLVIDRVRERDARAAREDAWGKIHTGGAEGGLAPRTASDPAKTLAAKQQVEAALEVLDGLPEKTRKVFLLHRFEGLSHAEVSERTGIPKSTIEKHMIKAIKALAVLRPPDWGTH